MDRILDICNDLVRVRFGPGDVMILEGEPEPGFFVLLEGTVAVRKGESEVARIGHAGAVFGEISALLGTPASASVVARTEVEARYIADGLGYLTGNPEMALHTARNLAHRLATATGSISDLRARFPDKADHFGFVDLVLDTLMQQEPLKGLRPRA